MIDGQCRTMGPVDDKKHETLRWVCPRCREGLTPGPGGAYCETDDLHFALRDGIWRFLLPERQAYFASFVEQYETVRRDEGWGTASSAYYRALPFSDLSGRHKDIWQIRAKSYEMLQSGVILPLAKARNRPLQVLDLGAGNGWLAYQLTRQGHRVIGVDLLTNMVDGLGAHIYYDASFVPVQAEFDRLPVGAQEIDVVIYNGALHYSTGYHVTLEEGQRVLRRDGLLVVMDSPIYRDPASGATMVRERQTRFAGRYNFTGQPLASENYLTFDRLAELAAHLGLEWTYLRPGYGLRWKSRRWLARLRSGRDPATFLVVAGRRL